MHCKSPGTGRQPGNRTVTDVVGPSDIPHCFTFVAPPDASLDDFDWRVSMARVASVEFAGESLSGSNARSTPDFDVAVTYERQIDVAAERERLTKELARLEKILISTERQLNNPAFIAKAPAHIVDGLRKQHTETKTLYDKTKAALDALN